MSVFCRECLSEGMMVFWRRKRSDIDLVVFGSRVGPENVRLTTVVVHNKSGLTHRRGKMRFMFAKKKKKKKP
jgi:hypothetical protein